MAEKNPELDALLELERRIRSNDQSVSTMAPDQKAQIEAKLKAYREQGLAKPLSEGPDVPKLTEAQSKAVGYYRNAIQANDDYEKSFDNPDTPEVEGPPARSLLGQKMSENMPNVLNSLPEGMGNSPERQKADQSQLSFIMATLRQESGAAISKSEIDNQVRRYFPMPGDSEAVIKQKSQARRVAIEALKAAAGPGAQEPVAAKKDELGAGESGMIGFKDDPTPPELAPRISPEQQKAYTDFVLSNQKNMTPDLMRSWLTSHDMPVLSNLDEVANAIRKNAESPNPATPPTEWNYGPADAEVKKRAAEKLDAEKRGGAAASAAAGAADTASLGFADELVGGARALTSDKSIGENIRDVRAEQEVLKDRHPGLFMGGQIAGGFVFPGLAEARTPAALAKEGGALGLAYGLGSGDTLPDRVMGAGGNALGGAALGYGAGRLIQRIGKTPPRETAIDVVRDATDIGINNLLPADVGGPVTRGLTAAARQGIVSEAPIARTVGKAVQEGMGARDAAASMTGSTLDRVDAGELVRKAANVYSRDTAQTGNALYTRAYEKMGDARMDLPIAKQALKENMEELAQSIGGKDDPLYKQFSDLARTIEGGAFTPKGVMMTRTRLRDQMAERGLRGSDADRRLGTIIDAAMTDVRNGLVASGKEDAVKALDTANAYWKKRVETIDEVLEPLLGKNAPRSGEQIFTSLENMARKKTGDAKRLSRLITALPNDEANSIRASVIHQLGSPSARNQGEGPTFSFTEFVGRWNEMSPEAKDVLFQGPARVQLDKLANVAEKAKATAKYANTSNTARAIGGQALISGSLGAIDLVTMGQATAAQGLTGLMLSSPKVAKVLASARSYKTKAAYAAALSRAAGENPALSSDVANFTGRLLSAVNDNAPRAAASGQEKEQ